MKKFEALIFGCMQRKENKADFFPIFFCLLLNLFLFTKHAVDKMSRKKTVSSSVAYSSSFALFFLLIEKSENVVGY